MEGAPQSSVPLRFGEFEVDLEARELRRNGLRIPLQDQPFRLLALLLERPGKIISRDEIQRKLWPADTFVEFDRSLNTAINKVREALGDSATSPQFVETVPRRGYRFVGIVDTADRSASDAPPGIPRAASGISWSTKAGLVALLLIAATALMVRPFNRPRATPDIPLRKFAFTSDEPVESGLAAFGRAAISPDGRKIAYFTGRDSTRRLWVWRLDRDEHKPYLEIDPGTHVGGGALQKYGFPFWSPDSLYIGFPTASELKKVAVETGAVSTVSIQDGFSRGAAWSSDSNTIVFTSNLRLYEVSSRGGTPKLLVPAEDSEKEHGLFTPAFVSSDFGRRLLLLSPGRTTSKIMLLNLASGRRAEVASGAWPAYSPTGHILYQRSLFDGGIWAVPFSVSGMSRTGEPFPVAERGSYPSVSEDGTLVYLEEFPRPKVLTWRTRSGVAAGEIGQPQKEMYLPSLSPNGQIVGVEGVENNTGADVWLHQVNDFSKTRLTMHPARDSRAIWSPDRKELVFWSDRDNGFPELFITPAAVGESARPLTINGRALAGEPEDWSSDGRYVIYWSLTNRGLCYVERGDEGGWKGPVCRQTPPSVYETVGRFSPNSRFLAYCSNESGRPEVYVQAFPHGGKKWPVSLNGGTQPCWRPDGRELFYVQRDTLMAVPISTAPEFSVGPARRLFTNPALEWEWAETNYDVSADGQRFILIEPKGTFRKPAIRVVQNWFSEFRDAK